MGAKFRDLWIKHREWVLDPIRYFSVDRLVEVSDSEVIKPAEARCNILLARKAEELRVNRDLTAGSEASSAVRVSLVSRLFSVALPLPAFAEFALPKAHDSNI
jgi:hypothetical protein